MKKRIVFVISAFLSLCLAFTFMGCSDIIEILEQAETAQDLPENAFYEEDKNHDSNNSGTDGSGSGNSGSSSTGNNAKTNDSTDGSSSSSSPDYNVSIGSNQIQIRDCDTGIGISGIPISVLSGNGSVIYTGSTGYNGLFTINGISDLPDGEYNIVINSSGSSSSSTYVGSSETITIRNGRIDNGNAISIPKQSTGVTSGSNNKIIKLILDWSLEPKDLDIHVEFGTNDHVYWKDKVDRTGQVKLDRDDIDSYGPETITIETNVSDSKEYKCYIHNWTDSIIQNNYTNRLSASNARVRVYINNVHAKTYNVPSSLEGLVWNVCTIKNGAIKSTDF